MKTVPTLAIGAMLGAATAGLTVAPGPAMYEAHAQAARPPALGWEYHVMQGHAAAAPDFNKLGADGWELCEMTPTPLGQGTVFAVFKRPKR